LTSNGHPTANGNKNGLEFRRLEMKYLVDRTRRTALTRVLAALMQPDRHASPDGFYTVRSLYFDTPDYMAYHQKLAGMAVRHKLRVRAYGVDVSQVPLVRMEVKSRYLNSIYKIAKDVPRDVYLEVERCLLRRTFPPLEYLEEGILPREFFRLQRQYNMEPKVIVEYRRQAFERVELTRTRVNFDDDLRASRGLTLFGPLRSARPILRPGHAILEIKVDGWLPDWVHRLIANYDLQDQALSKYCYAVRSEALLSVTERPEEPIPFHQASELRTARPVSAMKRLWQT